MDSTMRRSCACVRLRAIRWTVVGVAVLLGLVACSATDDGVAGTVGITTTNPTHLQPSTTTSTFPATTSTPATVPGPPEPRAPWDAAPVAPPADLHEAISAWREARQVRDPWDCAFYAPTEISRRVGFAPAFLPQATRVGDFQFGWDDPGGGYGVWVSIWPADNQNVERFFDDPDPTTYSDGSVSRQDPAGGDLLGDTLISIPGEPCQYEVSCDSTVSCSWAIDSFRRILLEDPGGSVSA